MDWMISAGRAVVIMLGVWMASGCTGVQRGVVETRFFGYDGCVMLFNKTCRVVLDPNCGGRVLEYSRDGRNVIKLIDEQRGLTWRPGAEPFNPCGGRFDVGPEMTLPRHDVLWRGRWRATITGTRSARLVSQLSDEIGVQVVRDFRLAEVGTELTVTQTVRNVSNSTVRCNYWGRTKAVGGGTVVVPLSVWSRYPKHYIVYGPDRTIQWHPDSVNVECRGAYMMVTGRPEYAKLGFDSQEGWLAYLAPNNLMFVKRYPVSDRRAYGEITAMSLSMYYYRDQFVELEPIGPLEVLEPGQSASFTVRWWLLDCPHLRRPDPRAVGRVVARCGR